MELSEWLYAQAVLTWGNAVVATGQAPSTVKNVVMRKERSNLAQPVAKAFVPVYVTRLSDSQTLEHTLPGASQCELFA
jgi:hypothetical protein